MNYGYIRVSSDRQTVENQRFEIRRFCEREGLNIDGWIAETVSGTMQFSRRRLGTLLKRTKRGDLIICSELSRLGRNLYIIMEILSLCMKRGCRVWTIKDNYRLGEDIQSKILAFAFGLSAEIERNLISQRTREAIARKKSEGKHVGRPYGSKSSQETSPLFKYDSFIRQAISEGCTQYVISQRLKCSRSTLQRYINRYIYNNNDTYTSCQDCQMAVSSAL